MESDQAGRLSNLKFDMQHSYEHPEAPGLLFKPE